MSKSKVPLRETRRPRDCQILTNGIKDPMDLIMTFEAGPDLALVVPLDLFKRMGREFHMRAAGQDTPPTNPFG